jgi:hypothetical protein
LQCDHIRLGFQPLAGPPGKKNRLGAGAGVLAGLKKLNAMSLSVTKPLVRDFSSVTATTLPSDSVARCEDSANILAFAMAILNWPPTLPLALTNRPTT